MDQLPASWAADLAEEIETRYPCRIQLGLDPGPHLVLFWILLPKELRGNGIGTRVMEHVLGAADRQGVPVTLSPSGKYGGDLDRLYAFYERFGFVASTNREQFGSAKESMVRVPRAPVAD
ncbi:GNAT family N-acetyltransferase [Streptomyces sp. NPDC088707]|uniref:GNAT family N-acetyltransferase n=1 Tax=Streptomyces sp. NPDC088707 TaxID=3365871 RepID=UPI003805A36F